MEKSTIEKQFLGMSVRTIQMLNDNNVHIIIYIIKFNKKFIEDIPKIYKLLKYQELIDSISTLEQECAIIRVKLINK